MNYFATIASAQEYITLLQQTLAETRDAIKAEVESGNENTRRVTGLMVAAYQLELGERHLKKCQQVLTNLRRLDRILCQ